MMVVKGVQNCSILRKKKVKLIMKTQKGVKLFVYPFAIQLAIEKVIVKGVINLIQSRK